MKPLAPSFLILLVLTAAPGAMAQRELPNDVASEIENRFSSWKLASIDESIVSYYAERRNHEKPNFIRGDWNGDGRVDYALILERRLRPENKLLVVLMRKGAAFRHIFLPANDCIMALKKGTKDEDIEARRTFTYRNDAIFSYYWEKGGSSYIWNGGRFRSVLTSD